MNTEASTGDKFDHKEFLAHVNGLPGVYRMIDRNDKVMYVGKAKNLKKRLASYFRQTGLSTRIMSLVNNINRIEVINTRTESEALLLENDLIKNLNPRYNILFRDEYTPVLTDFGIARQTDQDHGLTQTGQTVE